MLLRPLRDCAEDAEAVRLIVAASGRGCRTDAGGTDAGGTGGRTDSHTDGPVDEAPGSAYAVALSPGPHEPHGHGPELVRHLVRTDPRGGGWLMQAADGRPVGVAQAVKREGTWALALLAVVPEARGKGVGKALLDRAVEYGRGCLRGILCCPQQPAAARACRRAGFELYPAMRLRGKVDGTRLDTPDGPVVRGSAAHRDLLDSVDRRLRGGAHGADHDFLLRHHALFVSDDLAGSGYCYLTTDSADGTHGAPGTVSSVELLAATSRRLATRLLTAALLSVPEGTEVRVGHLTAEQQWAVDVGFAAGLELSTAGYVALRGLRPPSPYVPSRSFA